PRETLEKLDSQKNVLIALDGPSVAEAPIDNTAAAETFPWSVIAGYEDVHRLLVRGQAAYARRRSHPRFRNRAHRFNSGPIPPFLLRQLRGGGIAAEWF